jgi:hypothetical protein
MGMARRAVVALVIVDDSVFHLAVDLLLSAMGGGDKAVEPGQVEEETNEANAARPDFDAGEMEGNPQSV